MITLLNKPFKNCYLLICLFVTFCDVVTRKSNELETKKRVENYIQDTNVFFSLAHFTKSFYSSSNF